MYNRGIERSFVELRSLLRAKREPEMVLTLVRGAERFYVKWNCSLLMSKENQKSTSDFDALDPTGCGSQRLLRCRLHPAGRCPNSSSLYPPQAAVVAVALFSRFSDSLLRSWCYVSAGGDAQQRREIFGGAVNRRSTKKCV